VKIVFQNRQRRFSLDFEELQADYALLSRTLAESLLQSAPVKPYGGKVLTASLVEDLFCESAVSVVFLSNRAIRKLNNDFRGRFEKSFTTRQGDSRFTVYSNMVYDIFCDPDEELRLGRFVYTNTFYRNISTHLTHHEPVEVFSRSILISESDLSFKARAVRSVKESAPQYNHTTIRTQADEFVVASSGGHLVTTSASMALLERDYQPFTNSLGLSAEVRTRIDRLKRDEKGVKLISDPSLNLVVLRKLFGLTSLVAPDKQMLLNAITRAVVDSNHFDVNEFFATQ
jgi:hypothetical protein